MSSKAAPVGGLLHSGRLLAHSDAFATQFTSASDQSGHTSRRRSVAVECNGATPAPGGVALYLVAKRPVNRARKRSRPIRVTIAPPRTRQRSFACFHNANNQDWSRCPACMLHRGSRINLYPVERQRLVPKSCILVAARLQDGWDSSLVWLIAQADATGVDIEAIRRFVDRSNYRVVPVDAEARASRSLPTALPGLA